jgi:hypothetical protein
MTRTPDIATALARDLAKRRNPGTGRTDDATWLQSLTRVVRVARDSCHRTVSDALSIVSTTHVGRDAMPASPIRGGMR